MSRIRELTLALRSHDSCLYAQETKLGRIDVMRKSSYGETPPHFLFALTDDWKPTGRPVPWGIEVVINRIKAQDLWRDDTLVEQLIAANTKAEEAKDRDFRNSVESFLYEFRPQFHKATNEINTSTLEKKYAAY